MYHTEIVLAVRSGFGKGSMYHVDNVLARRYGPGKGGMYHMEIVLAIKVILQKRRCAAKNHGKCARSKKWFRERRYVSYENCLSSLKGHSLCRNLGAARQGCGLLLVSSCEKQD